MYKIKQVKIYKKIICLGMLLILYFCGCSRDREIQELKKKVETLEKQQTEVSPKKEICSECKGSGVVICNVCNGKGYVVSTYQECYKCKGRGRDVDGDVCSVCKGTGYNKCSNPFCRNGRMKCVNCKGSGYK